MAMLHQLPTQGPINQERSSFCLGETAYYGIGFSNSPLGGGGRNYHIGKGNLFVNGHSPVEYKSFGLSYHLNALASGTLFLHDPDGPLGTQDPVLFCMLPNLQFGAFASD